MSQQSLRQASCRTEAGTTGTYNEDWDKVFADSGFTTGTFSEKMLAYTNAQGSAWDNAEWDGNNWEQLWHDTCYDAFGPVHIR